MAVAITTNEPLANHTTFKLGGPASYWAVASSEADVEEVIHYAQEVRLPVLVLGGGSNVLVADAGFPGLVLQIAISGVQVVEETDATITVAVGAGENLDAFIATTVERGWWGLENLSHIPGTVGATPIQNVGAYGVEVSQFIRVVRAYDTTTATFVELGAHRCLFGYRDSVFKHEPGRYIVTSVSFTLAKVQMPRLEYRDLALRFKDQTPTQAEIRAAVIAIRAGKFPDWTQVGTAGSFFKNPIVEEATAQALQAQYPAMPVYPSGEGFAKLSLGWVLDKLLGSKGERVGNVGLYEAQALVLIAYEGATTAEVQAFAVYIKERVFEKINLQIEEEVTVVG
jgi:UDP-N-acetylmuramate dehydrogenase